MELKEEYNINDNVYRRKVHENSDSVILSEYLLDNENSDNWTTLLSALTLKKTEEVTMLDAVSEYAKSVITPKETPPSLTAFADENGNPKIYLLILMITNPDNGATEFTYQFWDKSDINKLISFSQFSIKMKHGEEMSDVLAKYNNDWVSGLLQVLRVMIPNGF